MSKKVLKSGIYVLRNIVNGNVYVGSAFNLTKRKLHHFGRLRNCNHRNGHLQRAFNKYGQNSFKFDILFYCDENSLTLFEQITIDFYRDKLGWDSLYNIIPNARSGWVIHHTEETKARISRSKMGHPVSAETRKMIGDIHRGSKWSDEQRAKFISSSTGKKHKYPSCRGRAI